MKLVPIVLTSIAALLAHAAIAADAPDAANEPPKIYECKDADGNVAYQDDPCKEAPPVAAKPKTAVVKPKPAAKSEKIAKSKAAPNPPVASKPTTTAKPAVASLPWAAVLPAAPPLPQHALLNPEVDARWTSPQRTLQTFVGAVKTGDRALVLACLTSSALAELGPDQEELPLGQLQATVASFTGYVVEGDLGPYWSVRALRAGERPKWIFLERTGFGEWKIGAF